MEWESASGGSVESLGKTEKKSHGCRNAFLIVLAVVVALFMLLMSRTVICAPFISGLVSCATPKPVPKELVWPSSGPAAMLPAPESPMGEITENSSERFVAALVQFSSDAYWSYVEACKGAGFVVDANQSGSSFYTAYSDEGYYLVLQYSDDSEELGVYVGAVPEEFTWPSSGLAEMLPMPELLRGEITENGAEEFRVSLVGYTKEDARAYIEACQEKGFTINAEQSGSSYYKAYSNEGYHLSLSFREMWRELRVLIEAPVQFGQITWPITGPASLVPAPVSTVGTINADRSSYFSAVVGDVSPDAFTVYCDAVAAAGFTVGYDRSADSYRGENTDGDVVRLYREGFNAMKIEISVTDETAEKLAATSAAPRPDGAIAPEVGDAAPAAEDAPATDDASVAADDSGADNATPAPADSMSDSAGQPASAEADAPGESAPAPAEQPAPVEESASAPAPDGVDPAFRATMDAYEAFFDEYIAFMNKYSSGELGLNAALDYAGMLTRYAEAVEEIDAIEEGELSAADFAYYTEVMTRVNQKLASAPAFE